MSVNAPDKILYERWLACLNLMVKHGVPPSDAASTMLAIAIKGLEVEWGSRRVGEMLSGVALELVTDATRREQGAAAEGAAGLDEIVRRFAETKRGSRDEPG